MFILLKINAKSKSYFLPEIYKKNIVTTSIKKVVATYHAEYFGAKGNGKTDDTKALTKAFNSPYNIILTKGKIYLIQGKITIQVSNKTISGYGAEIKKINNELQTLIFKNCNLFKLAGVKFTLQTKADRNSIDGQAVCLQIITCKNYIIKDLHIIGSKEMGICNMNCINGLMYKNHIEHTWRDGIYAHYSAKMTYDSNTIEDVKDDGLSMHDYGIPAQKPELITLGYKQAGHSKITNNIISNCISGISSIGCDGLNISGNVIKNTVLAGINLFNSDQLYKGTDAYVKNSTVKNNKLSGTDRTQTIVGQVLPNNGQLTSGRAAITVYSGTGSSNLYPDAITRLSNIVIQNNTIYNSGTNGIFCGNIDKVNVLGNKIRNCQIDGSTYTGYMIEINKCTEFYTNSNTIVDEKVKGIIHHQGGYYISDSNGSLGAWYISGVLDNTLGIVKGGTVIK
ncbi:MAG: right-handed parallel beta-helix repeat-containing protein [Janthinobacterium lividum]